MTLTDSEATSAMSVPAAGSSQSDTNRREQILVYHLLNTLVERLTDRTGTIHAFPWSPRQEVRIGVLRETYAANQAGDSSPPQTTGDDDSPDGDGGSTRGHAAPAVDNRGVIGVDFVVNCATESLELAVDVAYALYHPLAPPHAVIAAEAQRRAAGVAGNARRRPSVPIQPYWIRDNRRISLTIQVPITGLEHEVTSEQIPGGDPLEADANAAVSDHYTRPDALWELSRNQTLPVDEALGTPDDYSSALDERRDGGWEPLWPRPRLTVATMRTVEGNIAVSVSVTNGREVTERSVQDLAVYDTRMAVSVKSPASIVPQRLGFADDDLRYSEAATVVGRGRGCVAKPGNTSNTIVAATLPVHVQRHAVTTRHGVEITYNSLADGYEATLGSITTAMRSFLRDWPITGDTDEREQLQQLRDLFEQEVERFELGCRLLRDVPDLGRAFVLANRTFAASKGAGAAWRLFQLVFVVSELGALAGREDPSDPALRAELGSVDVLWFPTGGGKTEAYLGLIAVGLFFDRLRGKERGTTAWLLFPLRMLSVQQLARICDIVHHAESIRADEELGGDPFALGYLVGAGNTPNRLPNAERNGWWPGLTDFASWSTGDRDSRRLVSECPQCRSSEAVGLDADVDDQRLLHVCRQCAYVLPIHSSDEEVTRYQPAVVVSTVDKITSFARNGQLTSFNRGPRRRCPRHGWYTHSACVVKSCAADAGSHTDPTGFRDPPPALWIQDELHLVREELGVFAGHYHTLLAELASGAGHHPPKVIAATATIEQYEDQLSQVYGRKPRMFPVGGPTLQRSFYTEVTDDVRRLYLGVLPAGGGTVKVDLAATITTMLVKQIHELADDPSPLIAAQHAAGITLSVDDARAMLFDYELALAYVNAKAHGVTVQEDLHRLSESLINAGSDGVRSEYLTGETPLGELAGVIAAIQGDTVATPRTDRIRALVGTSVISHGVDLDRLNFEVLAGMPPSYAHYIQATARAGRTHLGLVVSVFDRGNRRETSMYQSFATTHAALERMVEPVPVNRFAARAVERTLPGIVCSLLWDETRNERWPSTEEISMTRKFRTWWEGNAPDLMPHLRSRIESAYRCPVPDAAMASDEERLVRDALSRWDNVECRRMRNWQAEWLTDLFTSPAMTSLRDVDPPVEFSGGNRAAQIVARLHA